MSPKKWSEIMHDKEMPCIGLAEHRDPDTETNQELNAVTNHG